MLQRNRYSICVLERSIGQIKIESERKQSVDINGPHLFAKSNIYHKNIEMILSVKTLLPKKFNSLKFCYFRF